MTPTLETLKRVTLQVLKEHFDEGRVAIVADLGPHFEKIAENVARYALRAAAGEPEAVENLEELKVQAGLLESLVYAHGYRQGVETFKQVMVAIARTVGAMVRAAIL